MFKRSNTFDLDFLVMYKNGLIRKIRIISKFMMSRHVLSNISRSKGNRTMKFGQLVVYNMGNNFVQKSYTKCGGENIPRPFSKKSKLSISLDQ